MLHKRETQAFLVTDKLPNEEETLAQRRWSTGAPPPTYVRRCPTGASDKRPPPVPPTAAMSSGACPPSASRKARPHVPPPARSLPPPGVQRRCHSSRSSRKAIRGRRGLGTLVRRTRRQPAAVAFAVDAARAREVDVTRDGTRHRLARGSQHAPADTVTDAAREDADGGDRG